MYTIFFLLYAVTKSMVDSSITLLRTSNSNIKAALCALTEAPQLPQIYGIHPRSAIIKICMEGMNTQGK